MSTLQVANVWLESTANNRIQYGGSNNIAIYTAGTSRLTLSSTGAMAVSNLYGITVTTPRNVFVDSSGNLGGVSSIRASKTNIESISDAEWLLQLNPVTFNYRVKNEEGRYTSEAEPEKMYGLIAEEVEEVNRDFCVYDESGKLISVYYDRMIAPLIKMVQDQHRTIEELRARIETLEAK